jgi:hypothetical protein
MSRKRLATNEMLYISAEWLKPESPAHKAILASTDLAPTLPRIQSAHQDLATAAQPTALNPRLFEIIKEQTDIDDRHDDVIRGIHGLLTATAFLLGSDDGAHLLALRDLLIPDGLATVQKSYGAEAGEASQLAARLTPEIRTQLDNILVGSTTQQKRLSAYLDEWIQLGEKLGALEIEKARRNPTEATASTGVNLVAARNKWIRTVNLFLAVAEAAEVDADTERLLFGPLRTAEIRAERRGRTATSTSNEKTGSEPAND